MSLLIHTAIDSARLEAIRTVAGGYPVVNAASEAEALAAIPDAEAFERGDFGCWNWGEQNFLCTSDECRFLPR